MRNNPSNRSVSLVIAVVAVLGLTVTGILFSDYFSDDVFVDRGFDPNILPATSAGISGKRLFARNCDDVIYRTTKDGIRYVRLAGGGPLIGAEYQKKFGFYRIEYGLLDPVNSTSVDSFIKEKLEFALYNCDGPFTVSGVGF